MKRNMIHTPEGVRDIYGQELARKEITRGHIHDVFQTFGYHDIQTPTFEYFDIFSNEVGTTPSKDLYKFFDKEGNTLVLRPDFTPSIARCAVKYFMENEDSVRLSYAGSAFTNVSELQGKFKETTQLGAELIGDGSTEADAEMICLVIEALKTCGFEQFTVSIGEVNFFKGICEEAKLSEETILQLREIISVKNYFGAEEMLLHRGVSKEYIDFIVNAGDIADIETLREMKKPGLNQKSLAAIERLEAIYEEVDAYGLSEYISFDLGMLSKFHYYTGVIFKAYTYGVGDAIVKGGRYDSLLAKFGKDAPAVGMVFLLDEIMNALSAQKKEIPVQHNAVWVVYHKNKRNEAYKRIQNLRAENIPVTGIRFEEGKNTETYQMKADKYGVNRVEII